MKEPRSKRVIVKTDKAASARAGVSTVVVKTSSNKIGHKRTRTSAAAIISDAVHAADEGTAAPAAAAAKKTSGARNKAGKKATSSKKLSKAAKKAQAPTGRWVYTMIKLVLTIAQELLCLNHCSTCIQHTSCSLYLCYLTF